MLQNLGSLTEYFLARDLSMLAKQVYTSGANDIEQWITDYRIKVFPNAKADILESAPDWDTEIGGLALAK